MALPSSGAISLSQVSVELGVGATTTRSLNDSTTRSLFGKDSGSISMSDGYGKSNLFSFTISSNQTNADLRTLAVSAGWDETTPLQATVDSGVYISSNSTGTPALTVTGSFPGGVTLVNNGFIVGMGGAGGKGAGAGTVDGAQGSAPSLVAGSSGSSGGLALSISTAVIINNAGTIGGGGGGGGGGTRRYTETYSGEAYVVDGLAGGGGGGGGRSSSTNSAGGVRGITWRGASSSYVPSVAGDNGTTAASGAGGAGGRVSYQSAIGGVGGTGGGWGTSGSSGGTGSGGSGASPTTAYSGGSAGAAVSGNSNITWVATGTRLGAIT